MENAQSLIDRLYGTFAPIYQKWKEWAPSDLYLWNDTATKTDTMILQADIRHLGEYFANTDMIGARTEYTLTAECIALLRIFGNKLPVTKSLLEQEIDNACRSLEHESKSEHIRYTFDSDAPDYDPPVSWRIAQHMTAAGRCSPHVLEGLYLTYRDLAHLFLLRDGNITPEEDTGWATFRAAFER